MADQVFTYSRLFEFTEQVFQKIGCSKQDATTAAKTVLSADLRGIDSHGVARLSGYVRLWEAKRVNAAPGIKVIHETPSTAVVDGDSGLGLVVAPFAMQIAIEKAKQAGTGWVSVQNSNHFGIAAHHAMMALDHDMIGIAMTNASPLVAPTFSIDRMLGTNPICVVAPAGNEPPRSHRAPRGGQGGHHVRAGVDAGGCPAGRAASQHARVIASCQFPVPVPERSIPAADYYFWLLATGN